MKELAKQIKSVRRSEERVLNNVKQLLVQVVQSLKETPDLEGVKKISDSPLCYTVTLETISKYKHGLDPDFYISTTQIAEIEKRITGMTTLVELQKFLNDAIDNRYIVCRSVKIALNQSVIHKLIEIKNCF